MIAEVRRAVFSGRENWFQRYGELVLEVGRVGFIDRAKCLQNWDYNVALLLDWTSCFERWGELVVELL